jgi:FtsP/CotA-like multicopper oxidase with cupredoxin domain
MPDMIVEDPKRRDLLRLGVTITAGAIVPPLVTACGGGGGDGTYVGPLETFVNPLDIQSKDGLLDVTIVVSYLTTTLQGTPVTLRNMFGTIPAPTLRMNVGDTLRIKIVNRLPPNPPSDEPTRHLRYHNSTNLHTHGLHVYPDIYPQPATPPYVNPDTSTPPKLYGDFVVDDPEQGIKPGEERQYEYRIRDDHPPGTYWYHPHLHGSSAMQVGSGMAGALIIEGAIDRVPEIDAAVEKVFVFQAPIVDANGKLEDFGTVAGITINEPPFIINGVSVPRIVMKAGEVQNWRFINAGTFKMLNLSLDGHTLYQYSHDGNTRRIIRPVPPIPVSAFTLPNPLPSPPPASYPEGVTLAVGNRTNVLVQAVQTSAQTTYYLRSFPIDMARNGAGLTTGQIVAEIVVLPQLYPMSLPANPLPVTPFLAPITDEELAANGGMKRTIVMRVIGSNPQVGQPGDFPFVGNAKTPLVDPPPGELPDWVYQTGATQIQGKVYALGSAGNGASTSPGMPTTYIPFQSSKAITQLVALDSVEEWTIVNMNNIRHPFHIHVNPIYVVAVNGQPIEPYWADTVALPANDTNPGPTPPPATGPFVPGQGLSSITFRTRFRHYTGRYVMHCHMLVHEDMGMMQGVTVQGPTSA